MKRIKAFLCLLLSLGLVLTLAGCGQQPQEEPEVPTLNISLDGGGWGGFQGKFSPFYASMVTDHQILSLIHI